MTVYVYIMGLLAPSSAVRTPISYGSGGAFVRLFLFRKYRKRVCPAPL
ncbi:hypothetical protein PT277_02255 [Acetobacteraceae bacterium ESL0709]|nr:hypothetical protein [Acetobacteraceae bacterium ESL0697]MDF7677525.1 hypothetical protein [Acetobacteraceae bacterium ESL0709]